MNTLKLFGKRIKELRREKKLTQEQLAEMCLSAFREATETKRASLI